MGILGAFDVVLGDLDGKVGLDRPLVADLLPDPGPVCHLGEAPDELSADEFGAHASISRGSLLTLRRQRVTLGSMQRTAMLLVLALALGLAAPALAAVRTSALRPAWTKNCTALHKRYPHGVGRYGAHDRTTGVPVRNFKHSNRLYRIAMSWNKGLDRDKDGIACEQH